MKPVDISTAKNPDLRASMAAIHRAAALARQTAIQTDTGIVIVQDGRIVHVSAQKLREDMEGKRSRGLRNNSYLRNRKRRKLRVTTDSISPYKSRLSRRLGFFWIGDFYGYR